MSTLSCIAVIVFLFGVAPKTSLCWTYIKAANKTDGFGAQLQAKISCILDARSHAHTVTYVHVPFVEIEHSNLGAGIEDLEEVTNLGHGELYAEDLPADAEIEERKDCNYWGDTHPHLYELMRRDLVHKMQSGSYGKALERPLSASSCGDADICVAIHIRRGDVDSGDRFLPNKHFSDIINGIIGGLEHHDLTAKFSIHSEGDETDFEDIPLQEERAVELYLNQPMLEAWLSLAAADILVTAHSSFSYSAALYNEGLTVYSKFWHSPLPSWMTYHDSDQLARAISQQHVGVLLRKKMAARLSGPESI